MTHACLRSRGSYPAQKHAAHPPSSGQGVRELAPAPEWVTHPTRAETKPKSSGNLLSGLLREPPEEGGRHTWLTRVAGCYASTAADHATYAELVRTVRGEEGKHAPVLDDCRIARTNAVLDQSSSQAKCARELLRAPRPQNLGRT